MKRKTKSILFGTALLAATGTVLAFGGPGNCEQHAGGMGKMGMSGGSMQRFNQIENLTNEQRAQLNELRKSQRDTMRSMRDAMSDNHAAIRNAMKDGANDATIQQLAEARGAAVTDMTLKRAEMKKKIDAILTEEQRNSLAAIEPSPFGKHRMGGHHNW